jgi:hypothetical protein
MCEQCSDGSKIWAAIRRLAAYSKLSKRSVQRLLRSLCKRGILTQLASANTGTRRPATYRINEGALQDDPRMAPYRNRQHQLPGTTRPPIPGEPIQRSVMLTPSHQGGDKLSPDLVTPRHQSSDTMSPDSKAFDSTTNFDSQDKGIHDETRAVLQKVGLPVLPPSVQVVTESIKTVMHQNQISAPDAADLLVTAALQAQRCHEQVNRFWFEDAKWNHYKPANAECPLHPQSDRTPQGRCWGCYAQECSGAFES